MNSTIDKMIQTYIITFTEVISEKYNINTNQLEDIWTEINKIPIRNKIKKRKNTLSAYVLFSKDKRHELKQDLSFGQKSKEIGRLWKEADDKTKKYYMDLKEQIKQPLEKTKVITNEPQPQPQPQKIILKKQTVIPDDIQNERERELWVYFADSKIAELRIQCEQYSLKTSKIRNDMIRSLVIHRMALENQTVEYDSD